MKLLRFKDKSNEQTRVGAIKNKNIVDLSEVNLPTDMIDFINLGDQGLETAKEFLESSIVGISPDDVYIKSPIKTPSKILAVGLNYKKFIGFPLNSVKIGVKKLKLLIYHISNSNFFFH